MNKISIKKEFELQLFAVMTVRPETTSLISSRLEVEEISRIHQTLYTKLIEMRKLDSALIVLELKKLDLFDSRLLDLGHSFAATDRAIEKLIRDIKDLSLAIERDSFHSVALRDSESKLSGLDGLIQDKENLENLIAKSLNGYNSEKSFGESLDDILNRLESPQRKTGLTTSDFPSFNAATGGINPGNLITIAGAFKGGKTSLALNLILDFCRSGISAGIISLEMPEVEIQNKIMGLLSGVPYSALRNSRLSQDQIKAVLNVRRLHKNMPLYISDRPATIENIKALAQLWRNRFGIQVLMIDYIGLVKTTSKGESREREISSYSQQLKTLSKELNISIIALSQLNRSGVSDATASNLAESLGLARDSDFLFTIQKPNSELRSIRMNGNSVEINENDFICKLDASRHTAAGKSFLLRMNEAGKMRERLTQYEIPEGTFTNPVYENEDFQETI